MLLYGKAAVNGTWREFAFPMSQVNGSEARDAASEARECCERIASAIEHSIRRAEELGDAEMVERLTLAKSRALRAGELVETLRGILEQPQPGKVKVRS